MFGAYVRVRRDFINSLHLGWIKVLRSPIASYSAVFTAVILSRIFQGERGEDTVNPLLRRMLWSVDPTPDVFRAAPVGSGQAITLRSTPYRSTTSSAKSQVVAPPVIIISSKM